MPHIEAFLKKTTEHAAQGYYYINLRTHTSSNFQKFDKTEDAITFPTTIYIQVQLMSVYCNKHNECNGYIATHNIMPHIDKYIAWLSKVIVYKATVTCVGKKKKNIYVAAAIQASNQGL